MKDIKILISSLLIIVSFFVGYLYSEEKNKKVNDSDFLQYVNIDIKKTKIKIDNQNKNVIFLINGEEINENEIKF